MEDFLVALYSYFSFSSNYTLNFQKLATCSESNGNKILKNVKTRWISFAWVAKRVLKE